MANCLIMALLSLVGACAEPPLPSLNRDKNKIAFDPKTCPIGASGGVHTGCMGVGIKILSRNETHCVFDYIADGCGGIRKSFPDTELKLLRHSGPGSRP
ncbi:MAG: hypothetical protein EXR99_13215 [Gemmataceae bacterium]|nr:hypothetical protein [Gemmataceae bacterium]